MVIVHRSTSIKWALCALGFRGLLISNVYSPLLNRHSTLISGLFYSAKKSSLRVEYIHMELLLGYVVGLVIVVVTAHPGLDNERKTAV